MSNTNNDTIIKKVGRHLIGWLTYIIPEKVFIKYAKGILVKKDKSFLTKIVRIYFNELYKHATPEKKKQLGLMVWGSKAAIQYFQERTYSKSTVNQFLSVILEHSDYDICEIGTGNGKLVAEISKQLPNRKFIGVDLNDEQIKINKSTYQEKNLQFVCADILEYVKNTPNRPTIFISYVSFTTFTPQMIRELFDLINHHKSYSIIVLYEPIESNTPDSNQSILRSGLAYAHNYTTIAKQKGFEIEEENINTPFLWLICKAHNNQ